MATQTQILEFINDIAPVLQREAKERGYKVVSPAIAQALQESLSSKSVSGISQLAERYHNYHGMKCGKYWLEKKKPSISMKTMEEYKKGTLTPITDFFRVYSDMESGLVGYYEFLSMNRYAAVKNAQTPEAYMEAIKAAGYCTSSTYISNCLKKIRTYNLTQYDSVCADNLNGAADKVKRPTLRRGSWGTDVTYLQQRLVANGYYVGEIDSDFGRKTENAVKAFQAEHNLVIDGIVGAETWAALGE